MVGALLPIGFRTLIKPQLQPCLVRFFIGYLHVPESLGVFHVLDMHFRQNGHTHDGG